MKVVFLFICLLVFALFSVFCGVVVLFCCCCFSVFVLLLKISTQKLV